LNGEFQLDDRFVTVSPTLPLDERKPVESLIETVWQAPMFAKVVPLEPVTWA